MSKKHKMAFKKKQSKMAQEAKVMANVGLKVMYPEERIG